MSLIRMIEVLNYIHVVIYIELNATKTASTYFFFKVDDDWMGRTMRYLEGAFNGIFFFFFFLWKGWQVENFSLSPI